MKSFCRAVMGEAIRSWQRCTATLVVAFTAVCGFTVPPTGQSARPLHGFVREVRSESQMAREARHREVARRRAGPIVIVHRGASSFTPENTIEAYAAAMDCGADGCEIDLRRSREGVLVLFHDDMLDFTRNGATRIRNSCGRPCRARAR